MLTQKKQVRILVADDEKDWLEKLEYLLENEGYHVERVYNHKETLKMLQEKNFDLVCMNIVLQGAVHDEWKLDWTILLDKAQKQGINVIVISAMNKVVNVKDIYDIALEFGVKAVFFKDEITKNKFVEKVKITLEGAIQNVVKYSQKNTSYNRRQINDSTEGVNHMNEILDLLTKATITTGIKYLFDQFTKFTDRLNKDQLDTIKAKKSNLEESAKAAQTEQDILPVKNSIKKLVGLLPHEIDITSPKALGSWIKAEIHEGNENLIEVSQWVVKILDKKAELEENSERKANFMEMESFLQNDIQEFQKMLKLGGIGEEQERNIRIWLYKRLIKAANLLQQG